MAAPKKDETQGTEATGDASGFAKRFPLQDIDLFGGTGTRGEEVELDEEELAKKAGIDRSANPTGGPTGGPTGKAKAKTKKKKRFGFG